jgi:hypothetical protein
MTRKPKAGGDGAAAIVSPRHFVSGIDDFAAVLEGLEHQVHSLQPRTHERALALFAVTH